MHIVKNVDWLISSIVLAVGASIYYSMAVVWPLMAQTVYADPNDPMKAAWIACASAAGTSFGAIFSGGLSKLIGGHAKYQVLVTITLGGALIACKLYLTSPLHPPRPATIMKTGRKQRSKQASSY